MTERYWFFEHVKTGRFMGPYTTAYMVRFLERQLPSGAPVRVWWTEFPQEDRPSGHLAQALPPEEEEKRRPGSGLAAMSCSMWQEDQCPVCQQFHRRSLGYGYRPPHHHRYGPFYPGPSQEGLPDPEPSPEEARQAVEDVAPLLESEDMALVLQTLAVGPVLLDTEEETGAEPQPPNPPKAA